MQLSTSYDQSAEEDSATLIKNLIDLHALAGWVILRKYDDSRATSVPNEIGVENPNDVANVINAFNRKPQPDGHTDIV